MVINHTIIATNEDFKLVWDDEEKEYQIIRKRDRRIRVREVDELKVIKYWNQDFADEDSKIEPANEQSVSKLTVIATSDSFELVLDNVEGEYQIIRKSDSDVRDRSTDKEEIFEQWNDGYSDDDAEEGVPMNQSVSKLTVGQRVDVNGQTWYVHTTEPQYVMFRTNTDFFVKIDQQSVLNWVSID